QVPAAHVIVPTLPVTKFILPSIFPPVLGQVTGVTTPFLSISSLMIVATSFVCAQSEPVTGVPPHVTVESWICTSLPTSILNLPCLRVQALRGAPTAMSDGVSLSSSPCPRPATVG